MVVVIRNALTGNELRYVSRLPEMAGCLFILLIVKVIRYTLLIDFKCVVECDPLVGGYASFVKKSTSGKSGGIHLLFPQRLSEDLEKLFDVLRVDVA